MSQAFQRLLWCVCPALGLINLPSESRAADQQPSIVVIVSDDAGYNDFSMHGSTICPTPRIDSIAEHGVRFSNGYVSGSVCSPTRAGLLTGRYQTFFGHEFNIPPVYSDENGLPLSETTVADGLRSAGYRTIALGKWHLGYAPKFHPMQRGFTDYYGFLQGARSYFPLTPPTQLNELLRDRTPQRPEDFGYMTDELARAAVEYIKDSRDTPFFMYLAFNATHTPLHTLPEDEATAEKLSSKSVKIRAMTIALDRAVGTVIDGLNEQELLDNTLLIFVNDNGGAAGHDNAPLRGQKGQTWEGGIRVPFAMQWPAKLPSGLVYEHPVIALDIFPTAMAAAEAAVDENLHLSGVNLLPHLTGETTARPHQTLYWKNADKWAVRDGDLKLVAGNPDQPAGQPALYDLAADIGESTDLAPGHPDEVARITALYDDWNALTKPTLWRRGEEGTASPRRQRRGRSNTSPSQQGAATN
jgi:arylsulfatase A-like enzyme